MHSAIHNDNKSIVQLLLKRGMSPDFEFPDTPRPGFTPLMIAVAENRLDFVKLLHKAGISMILDHRNNSFDQGTG